MASGNHTSPPLLIHSRILQEDTTTSIIGLLNRPRQHLDEEIHAHGVLTGRKPASQAVRYGIKRALTGAHFLSMMAQVIPFSNVTTYLSTIVKPDSDQRHSTNHSNRYYIRSGKTRTRRLEGKEERFVVVKAYFTRKDRISQ